MAKPEFSKREQEVIECLLKGKSNKEIAQEMGVSVRTVEFHLSNIYPRLEVHSRTEAVLKLTQSSLEGPASRNTSNVLRESTVEKEDARAENEGNQKQRRFPMKEILTVLVVLFSSVINIRRDPPVVIGTATPSPISYETEETLPPTPTPLRMEDTPPPTPTQVDVTPILICTPPPCPDNNFACGNPNGCPGGCGTICLTATPLRMKKTPRPTRTPLRGADTSSPTPIQIEVTPILICTPPPCPGNNFACGNPNGCPGGCGTICLTATPLPVEDTTSPTPLPLLLEETPTPIP